MWEYDYTYISHSGTKGMKWGQRRWQNEDGSLTPAGRVHYGYGQKKKNESLKEKIKNKFNKTKKIIEDHTDNEAKRRVSEAIKVVKEGDTDWFDNPIHSDNSIEEAKNRGKAALERLLYSEDQIKDRKLKQHWDKFDKDFDDEVNEQRKKVEQWQKEDEEWNKKRS